VESNRSRTGKVAPRAAEPTCIDSGGCRCPVTGRPQRHPSETWARVSAIALVASPIVLLIAVPFTVLAPLLWPQEVRYRSETLLAQIDYLRRTGHVPNAVADRARLIAGDMLRVYMRHFYEACWLFVWLLYLLAWLWVRSLVRHLCGPGWGHAADIVLAAGMMTLCALRVWPPLAF
jgi:hypothetical protein